MTRPAIVWFRDDLRVSDHAALTAAIEGGRAVVAVYVLDEPAAGAWAPGGASRWWPHHSLASLVASLARRGGALFWGTLVDADLRVGRARVLDAYARLGA